MMPCTSSAASAPTGSTPPTVPPGNSGGTAPLPAPPRFVIPKKSATPQTEASRSTTEPKNRNAINGNGEGPNGTKSMADESTKKSENAPVRINGACSSSAIAENGCNTNGGSNRQTSQQQQLTNGVAKNSGISQNSANKKNSPPTDLNNGGSGRQQEKILEVTPTPSVEAIVNTKEPSVSEKVELWMRQASYTEGMSKEFESKPSTAAASTPSPAPVPSSSAAQTNSEAPKKRRAPAKRPAPVDDSSAMGPPRQSKRKTRADEDEIVDNYVGNQIRASRRTVNPPIGGVRQPFLYPTVATKEKERLRIDMVGPKTRSNVLETPLEEPLKKEKAQANTKDGSIKEDKLPVLRPLSEAEKDEERDELVWQNTSGINWNDVNKAWHSTMRQSRGQIPLDAMLHRLMLSGYNVKRMLKSIETERWERLPQPFERFNTMQQLEFERMIRKDHGKFREGEKHFRYMQEKFLRKYYQGELVNYYYSTKKKRCFHQVFQRCQCREESCSFPTSSVSRYECAICTEYLWSDSPLTELCDVCKLYNKMTKKYRENPPRLVETEEQIVLQWKKMTETTGKLPTIDEVLTQIETDRIDNSMTKKQTYEECSNIIGRYQKDGSVPSKHLLRKFEPKDTSRCSLLKPWGNEARRYKFKEYSENEQLAFVAAFKNCNLDKKEVAKQMDKTEEEIEVFLARYGEILNLSKKSDAASSSNDDDSRPTTPLDESFDVSKPDLDELKFDEITEQEAKTMISNRNSMLGRVS